MRKITLHEFIYRNHTRQSADSYMYLINHFIDTNKNAKDFKYQDIKEYMLRLQDRYQNSATRNTRLAAIKRYFDYLLFTDYRQDHPCRKFKIKVKKNRDVQFQNLLSGEQLSSLMNRENRYVNLESRNKVIIGLMIYQGLTSGELINLKVEDIDLTKATVYCKGSKSLSSRTLRLEGEQITLLRDYIDIHRKNLLKSNTHSLIVGTRGMAISVDGIHSIFDQFKMLFGGKVICPSIVRQSVIANWLNEENREPQQVQLMAGHKWISTTMKYVRKSSIEQVAIINQFHPLG